MRLRQVTACALLVIGVLALPAQGSGCSTARSVRGHNPGYARISQVLDAAATRHSVPPPVLKALAWRESGWAPYFTNGRAKVSADCGVGLMQITGGSWDYRRLAADVAYNADAGAQVLAGKMRVSSRTATAALGGDDPRVLENWYRAAFRYNGSGTTAERYADTVFELIRKPPSGIAPWDVAVPVTSPKSVIPGYRPTSGVTYVAQLDGTWRSSAGGTYRHSVLRADYMAVNPRTTEGQALEADQTSRATFLVRNVGWATWTPDRVSLGTAPMDRTSALQDGTWVDAATPARLYTAAAPGQDARFMFTVRAPAVTSQQDIVEGFVPQLDGAPIAGVASSTWTIYPAQLPTASITVAPAFVTEAGTNSDVTIGITGSDPQPGSGLDRIEVVSRLKCATCAWSAPMRATGTAVHLTLAEPGAHEVKVRAVDRAGHYSDWSPVSRVIAPYDDTSAVIGRDTSWTTQLAEDAWHGSVHSSGNPVAWMQLTATDSTTFAVIGATGPSFGAFTVYLDKLPVAFVQTDSAIPASRRVLWQGSLPTGQHTLRIEAGGLDVDSLTGNSNGPLSIDAIAAA